MARIFFQAIPTAEIALTAATVRTVVQVLAPTNHRIAVIGWGVSFDGVAVTNEPVQVELVRQTAAGTMTALTLTQSKPVAETILSSASHSATSTEPTTTDILDVMEVHPQGGFEKACDFEIAGGGRVAIRCTAPAGVNVRPKLFCEE